MFLPHARESSMQFPHFSCPAAATVREIKGTYSTRFCLPRIKNVQEISSAITSEAFGRRSLQNIFIAFWGSASYASMGPSYTKSYRYKKEEGKREIYWTFYQCSILLLLCLFCSTPKRSNHIFLPFPFFPHNLIARDGTQSLRFCPLSPNLSGYIC